MEIGQSRLIPNNRNRTWKGNGSSLFLSLSKFGLSPSKESPEYLSRYFNMGTLDPIDNDLGYLLASLLERGEKKLF